MQLIAGTVLEIDEERYFCRIQPDHDSIPILENVPLRVFNLQDDLGVIIIPEPGTPCLVKFVGGITGLPTIFKIQRWQKIIVKRQDVFESIIHANGDTYLDTQGNVDLKVQGNVEGIIQGNMIMKVYGQIQLGPQGAHKGAWGDQWLIKHNVHIHPTPDGPSGPPSIPIQDPEVNSQKVSLD